ncbi:ABC transporter permease [Devriesea agamarum]|uniref:ABC transporter permease n=1 Tax=Devriesea agamarum TaxID=472569 RepID=UPI000B15F485|nr:ABC transporter permease [Devriesea agamarum]
MTSISPHRASTPPPPATPSTHGTLARPAPVLRRVLTHIGFETKILLSNGEQLLVAIIMPAMLLGALRFVPVGRLDGISPINTAAAAMFATAILSTSFTSQAIATGFDRRAGVLRWVATTPLGRDGYLLGKIGAVIVVQLLQFMVLGVLALIMGWRPEIGGILAAVPMWILGAWAMTSLGLLLAGTLRTEAVLALANTLFLLLVALGGIAIPLHNYPSWAQGVLHLLPSAGLGDGMRSALISGHIDAMACLSLAVWAIIGTGLVAKLFRWTSA